MYYAFSPLPSTFHKQDGRELLCAWWLLLLIFKPYAIDVFVQNSSVHTPGFRSICCCSCCRALCFTHWSGEGRVVLKSKIHMGFFGRELKVKYTYIFYLIRSQKVLLCPLFVWYRFIFLVCKEPLHSGGHIAPPHSQRILDRGLAGKDECSEHMQKLWIQTLLFEPLLMIFKDSLGDDFERSLKMLLRAIKNTHKTCLMQSNRCSCISLWYSGQSTDLKVSSPIFYVQQLLCSPPPPKKRVNTYLSASPHFLWVLVKGYFLGLVLFCDHMRSACTHIMHYAKHITKSLDYHIGLFSA